MAKINHTSSTDSTAEFRGQPLAGVACIGGLVELDHGKRLVVQFEGPAIGPAPRRSVPVEIRADADPELFGAVKDHVLGEFRVSPHHGISRLGRAAPGQLGRPGDAVAGLAQRDHLGAALRVGTAAAQSWCSASLQN